MSIRLAVRPVRPRLGRAAAALTLALAVAGPAACAPRQINVSSGPEPAAAGLAFTNNLRTAVNVYARAAGGGESFLRQVPAGATETLVVRNVAPGQRVSLRASPVDGARPYTREDVALGTGASWTIP